jgi:hypothetical protein
MTKGHTPPIDGEIVPRWPVEEVYAFMTDARNEDRYRIPYAPGRVDLRGPIGRGTRFLY